MLDYELRSRIRSGEVQADQKVWFSDLEEWTAVGELELFAHEFREAKIDEDNVEGYLQQLDEELESTQEVVPTPPPVPAELHLWRRFGARWFDYLAYMSVFFGWVAWTEVSLEGLRQRALFPVVLILPWVFLEAVALHFWGTTPGKWLVGLRVRDKNSRKLTAGAALLRTVRVMILGMGFGRILLREICHLLALWFAIKKKVVLWDASVGIRLERAEESTTKWVIFGLGMLVSLGMVIWLHLHITFTQMSPEDREDLGQQWREALTSNLKK